MMYIALPVGYFLISCGVLFLGIKINQIFGAPDDAMNGGQIAAAIGFGTVLFVFPQNVVAQAQFSNLININGGIDMKVILSLLAALTPIMLAGIGVRKTIQEFVNQKQALRQAQLQADAQKANLKEADLQG